MATLQKQRSTTGKVHNIIKMFEPPGGSSSGAAEGAVANGGATTATGAAASVAPLSARSYQYNGMSYTPLKNRTNSFMWKNPPHLSADGGAATLSVCAPGSSAASSRDHSRQGSDDNYHEFGQTDMVDGGNLWNASLERNGSGSALAKSLSQGHIALSSDRSTARKLMEQYRTDSSKSLSLASNGGADREPLFVPANGNTPLASLEQAGTRSSVSLIRARFEEMIIQSSREKEYEQSTLLALSYRKTGFYTPRHGMVTPRHSALNHVAAHASASNHAVATGQTISALAHTDSQLSMSASIAAASGTGQKPLAGEATLPLPILQILKNEDANSDLARPVVDRVSTTFAEAFALNTEKLIAKVVKRPAGDASDGSSSETSPIVPSLGALNFGPSSGIGSLYSPSASATIFERRNQTPGNASARSARGMSVMGKNGIPKVRVGAVPFSLTQDSENAEITAYTSEPLHTPSLATASSSNYLLSVLESARRKSASFSSPLHVQLLYQQQMKKFEQYLHTVEYVLQNKPLPIIATLYGWSVYLRQMSVQTASETEDDFSFGFDDEEAEEIQAESATLLELQRSNLNIPDRDLLLLYQFKSRLYQKKFGTYVDFVDPFPPTMTHAEEMAETWDAEHYPQLPQQYHHQYAESDLRPSAAHYKAEGKRYLNELYYRLTADGYLSPVDA